VLSQSPLIRRDGPVSIRRGFLPQEVLDMASTATWKAPRVYGHPFSRLVIVGKAS
jgi:hypothetical protein